MLKLRVVAVGDMKESYYREAAKEYVKWLGKWAKIEINEVREATNYSDPTQKKNAEGEEILKKAKGFLVLLDVKGKKVSSESFAELIDRAVLGGNGELSFVIGGSNGVSDAVKAAAKETVSFGDVTLPHRLFRVILLEQIYRAETILHGAAYHK